MLGKNRVIIFGAIAAIFLVGLFFSLVFMQLTNRSQDRQESPIPTPFVVKNTANPPAIASLPKKEGTQAINTNEPIVQSSESEVQKISAYIPYITEITTPGGTNLSIVIPEKSLQTDPWKLTVQIFGINYNVLPEEPDYQKERSAFIFGANHVFAWMREKNVDPEKVIIKWGDRAFIQQKAEEWLKP